MVFCGKGELFTLWVEFKRRFKSDIGFCALADRSQRATERVERRFRLRIQSCGGLQHLDGFSWSSRLKKQKAKVFVRFRKIWGEFNGSAQVFFRQAHLA